MVVVSSKGGAVSAPFNVGLMYEQGLGVIQNYKEAAKWYEIGVGRGSDLAQNNLAALYRKGLGVPRDVDKAIQLLNQLLNTG